MNYRRAFVIMSNECKYVVNVPGFNRSWVIESKRDVEAVDRFMSLEKIPIVVHKIPYSDSEVNKAQHKMFPLVSIGAVALIIGSAELTNHLELYD